MSEAIVASSQQKMDKAVESFKQELAKLRTGRASLSLLDGIRADCYGSSMPLNQLGTLAVPEPRLITVVPWDKSIIPAIEKAILESNLGLNPANDGKVVRIPIPPLTEERRRDLAKVVRKMGEEVKVAVRHIRREANEELRKAAKERNLGEDEVAKIETEIQKLTDQAASKIDETVGLKEKEIMAI